MVSVLATFKKQVLHLEAGSDYLQRSQLQAHAKKTFRLLHHLWQSTQPTPCDHFHLSGRILSRRRPVPGLLVSERNERALRSR